MAKREMMTPIMPPGLDDYVTVFAPPEGWNEDRDGKCLDLPVVRTNTGEAVSCWKPSLRDIVRILIGKPIWLSVYMGGQQPPVCVSTLPLAVASKED